jgi:alpha-galactosidase
MRTIPMFEAIGLAIKEFAPNAWVINYTNPMTLCVKTLYRVFPEIKAFGCCHEVFGTQSVLRLALEQTCGITVPNRNDIKVNVIGVNHFTWLTDARYQNIDLMPVYESFARQYAATGYLKGKDANWMNNSFACSHRVKFDLFLRYGAIAAAGDRHLAEFCPGKWYLADPDTARNWGFGLTTVTWRKNDLQNRLEKSRKLRSGETPIELKDSGEEGVYQMRALLGLCEPLVTNVNIPNQGQIPNLPLGAVVETNAVFRDDSVIPVHAGPIPKSIYGLISRICAEQEMLIKACIDRDLDLAFQAFTGDPLVTINTADARKLFDEMVENTKEYLGEYL